MSLLKKTIWLRHSKEDTLFHQSQKFPVKTDKYKGKAKVKYDKLILDGIEYGVEDLNNLADDMLTWSSSQKSNDNTVVFFGQHSPFSNFYQVSFEHDGHC